MKTTDRIAALKQEEQRVLASMLVGSFRELVRWAFGVLFPSEQFIPGRHIDAICDHLEALGRRTVDWHGLIINVPPRHMKSLLVSVFWPVWLWLQRPSEQVLSASYAMSLAKRDAVRSRRVLEAPQFLQLFGDLSIVDGRPQSLVTIRDDQNEKMRYENRAGGFRMAVSVGGGATGEGGSVRILDDPQKAEEATSEVKATSTIDWIAETWVSRTVGRAPIEVLVMQRLNERDVTSYYLKERTGFQHLVLPAICEGERRCKTALPFSDWRDDGQALWPEMLPVEKLRELSANEYVWNGQYRQCPTTKGGAIVKEKWLRFWRELPKPDDKHPAAFDFIFSSWDCKFKRTTSGSWVVGQLWAVRWPQYWLIDQRRGRWGFTETLDTIREATATWAAQGFVCHSILVEEKANGAAIVEVLQGEIAGVLPREVKGGDKVARLQAETPSMQSGCVYLPDPQLNPWVKDYLAEVLSFPFGEADDQVDATSQALSFAREAFAQVVFAGGGDDKKERDDQQRPVDDDDLEVDALYQ